MIVGIDPGTRDVAVAFCDQRGILVSCHLLRSNHRTLADRTLHIASQFLDMAPQEYLTGIVEKPMIYPQGTRHRDKSKRVDPNDIVDLSSVAGAMLVLCDKSSYVKPQEWKGQMPKDVCHKRIKKILSKEETETLNYYLSLVPSSLRHNVLDSVGIALHGVKRGPKNHV